MCIYIVRRWTCNHSVMEREPCPFRNRFRAISFLRRRCRRPRPIKVGESNRCPGCALLSPSQMDGLGGLVKPRPGFKPRGAVRKMMSWVKKAARDRKQVRRWVTLTMASPPPSPKPEGTTWVWDTKGGRPLRCCVPPRPISHASSSSSSRHVAGGKKSWREKTACIGRLLHPERTPREQEAKRWANISNSSLQNPDQGTFTEELRHHRDPRGPLRPYQGVESTDTPPEVGRPVCATATPREPSRRSAVDLGRNVHRDEHAENRGRVEMSGAIIDTATDEPGRRPSTLSTFDTSPSPTPALAPVPLHARRLKRTQTMHLRPMAGPRSPSPPMESSARLDIAPAAANELLRPGSRSGMYLPPLDARTGESQDGARRAGTSATGPRIGAHPSTKQYSAVRPDDPRLSSPKRRNSTRRTSDSVASSWDGALPNSRQHRAAQPDGISLSSPTTRRGLARDGTRRVGNSTHVSQVDVISSTTRYLAVQPCDTHLSFPTSQVREKTFVVENLTIQVRASPADNPAPPPSVSATPSSPGERLQDPACPVEITGVTAWISPTNNSPPSSPMIRKRLPTDKILSPYPLEPDTPLSPPERVRRHPTYDAEAPSPSMPAIPLPPRDRFSNVSNSGYEETNPSEWDSVVHEAVAIHPGAANMMATIAEVAGPSSLQLESDIWRREKEELVRNCTGPVSPRKVKAGFM